MAVVRVTRGRGYTLLVSPKMTSKIHAFERRVVKQIAEKYYDEYKMRVRKADDLQQIVAGNMRGESDTEVDHDVYSINKVYVLQGAKDSSIVRNMIFAYGVGVRGKLSFKDVKKSLLVSISGKDKISRLLSKFTFDGTHLPEVYAVKDGKLVRKLDFNIKYTLVPRRVVNRVVSILQKVVRKLREILNKLGYRLLRLSAISDSIIAKLNYTWLMKRLESGRFKRTVVPALWSISGRRWISGNVRNVKEWFRKIILDLEPYGKYLQPEAKYFSLKDAVKSNELIRFFKK
jgi:hypothetical protein